MATVEGPLFSLQAQGRLGPVIYSVHGQGTIAYGIPRPTVKPPTEAQLAQRKKFKDALDIWLAMEEETKKIWAEYAAYLPIETDKRCHRAILSGNNVFTMLYLIGQVIWPPNWWLVKHGYPPH